MGLVSWGYRFNDNRCFLNDPQIRKQWITNVTQSLFELLERFATPYKVELGTLSKGMKHTIHCEEPNFHQNKYFSYLCYG
ncbi:hypothetical protein PLACP1_31240 [Planifilum fimeticola]